MNGGYVAGREEGDFRIFVSFAGNDNIGGELTDFVERLAAAVDDARGHDHSVVFFSDTSIPRGHAWRKRIDEELAAADLFVPVVSQSFFYSKYCARELAAYLPPGAPAGEPPVDRPILPLFWMDAAEVPDADLQGSLSVLRRPPGEPLLRRMSVSHRDAFDQWLDDLGYRIREYCDARRPPGRHASTLGENAAFRWDRRPPRPLTAYADGVFRVVVGYGDSDNNAGRVDQFVADLRVMYGRVSGRHDREFTFTAVSPSSPNAAVELVRADAYIPLLSPTLLYSAACSRQLSAFLRMYQDTVSLAQVPDDLVYPVVWRKCPWIPVQFNDLQITEIIANAAGKNFHRYQRDQARSPVYDEELEKLARQLDDGAKREDGLERVAPLDLGTTIRAWDRHYPPSTYSLFRVGVTNRNLPHFERDGAFASGRNPDRIRFYTDSVPGWDPYRKDGGDISESQVEREMSRAAKRLRMKRVVPFRDDFCADMMAVGSAEDPHLQLAAGNADIVVLTVDPWLLQHEKMRQVLTSVCTRHAGPRVVVAPLSGQDTDVSDPSARGLFLDHMESSFGACGGEQEFIGGELATVEDFATGVYTVLERWASRSSGSSGGRSFNPGIGDDDG
jgi:hypothetical protein